MQQLAELLGSLLERSATALVSDIETICFRGASLPSSAAASEAAPDASSRDGDGDDESSGWAPIPLAVSFMELICSFSLAV